MQWGNKDDKKKSNLQSYKRDLHVVQKLEKGSQSIPKMVYNGILFSIALISLLNILNLVLAIY